MKLLGISGSPSTPSKTLLLVEAVVGHARSSEPNVDASVVNLRDRDVILSDGRDPADYEGDTRAVIDEVVAADALVVGTPMYRGGYTGRLKNLFDVLPNDALEGKPVGIVATGGSDHHFLAIEHELKPLVGFFRAYPVPGAVYAHDGHFAGGEISDEGIVHRTRQLAGTLVEFASRMPRTLYGADGPAIPRRFLRDS
ncbi:NADPH-dependent FMN reductase [Pseudonocardia endophytica]|uniref:FMN reductase/FAD reductase [NAD(P)H] n=1 Tax=Pseudonocardia endophytica TaxID=401976 RepID=A0A4V6NDI4_PSEEN|nr:NADPH-dependent FMN reductase [Pseudonocardia endophytica]TCK25186.1 FMN reductase/FAD reductase [NAD(P)H] [Pseudonocardia endophytica]